MIIALLMIIMSATPGLGYAVVIHTYPSAEACESERLRIKEAMEAVYPVEEQNFIFECHLMGEEMS